MNTEFEYSRLRFAREKLGLTQKEAANSAGISQRDISQLESGIKKFFLFPYILFLNTNGINLNILFSNELNIQNLIIQKPYKITAIDPLNIQFDSNQFKYSRERAGLTQKQAADRSSLSQRDISQLESGQKKFIPIQYILFLNKIKADLNEIFKYSSPSAPIAKITEKSLEKPIQNKAPENRLFETQLSIDTDKPKEIVLEKTLQPTPSNLFLNNEVNLKDELPKAATIPEQTVISKPIKAAGTNLKLVSSDQHAEYLKKNAEHSYITSLPGIVIPGYDKEAFRAFEIQGREMEPIFFEQDIVIGSVVENRKQVENNQLYVLVTDKAIVLRRLINCLESSDEFILLSDNEKSSSQIIKNDKVQEIWKFKSKITSAVDNLKAGFNELYYQLLKIQKELELIRSRLDK